MGGMFNCRMKGDQCQIIAHSHIGPGRDAISDRFLADHSAAGSASFGNSFSSKNTSDSELTQ